MHQIPNRLIVAILGLIIVLGIVVALVYVFLPGGETPTAETARITVEEIVNRVATAEEETFTPALAGEELRPGFGVKTFADSEARVDVVIRGFLRIVRTKAFVASRTR